MFFDLHLAYFKTSGLTEKWEFALRLKNLGILLVKLETLYKDVSKRSKIKAENKRKKRHGGEKIWILCSSGKNNISRVGAALPWEHKIHIFKLTRNVLFII